MDTESAPTPDHALGGWRRGSDGHLHFVGPGRPSRDDNYPTGADSQHLSSAALQALREIPYNKWRLYDHEDTVRFYSLRLREGGIVKSSPQKIIAQGTDWRFLNQLKRELKG